MDGQNGDLIWETYLKFSSPSGHSWIINKINIPIFIRQSAGKPVQNILETFQPIRKYQASGNLKEQFCARTTDAQRGNSLHCMAENSIPIPSF